MKFPFFNDPRTGQPDEMITLSVITTLAAVVRFLFDGVTINIMTHSFTFGHVDATVYMALLTPVLAAHGYVKGKGNTNGN